METRRAAACQIGEAAAIRPHEDLGAFLRRLADLLRRGSWETRVAAGEALDKVLAAVAPIVFPAKERDNYLSAAKEERDEDGGKNEGRLSLRQLDIQLILTKG